MHSLSPADISRSQIKHKFWCSFGWGYCERRRDLWATAGTESLFDFSWLLSSKKEGKSPKVELNHAVVKQIKQVNDSYNSLISENEKHVYNL